MVQTGEEKEDILFYGIDDGMYCQKHLPHTTEIDKIWKQFENIPVDENDNIEVPFYLWQKGENKHDIWSWFDEKSNGKYPIR